MATDKQVAMVKELLSQDRIDKMLAYYKIDSVEGLTVKQASDIIKKRIKMIEFIEETHTYIIDGVVVPSVSQILGFQRYSRTSIRMCQSLF